MLKLIKYIILAYVLFLGYSYFATPETANGKLAAALVGKAANVASGFSNFVLDKLTGKPKLTTYTGPAIDDYAPASKPQPPQSQPQSFLQDDCAGHKQSCMYDGHYQPGERAYAQQAAATLNNAQAAWLRINFNR